MISYELPEFQEEQAIFFCRLALIPQIQGLSFFLLKARLSKRNSDFNNLKNSVEQYSSFYSSLDSVS